MIRRPLGMELALLGFLRAGPQHGYQIYQTLSNSNELGLIWSLKQSQLYALFSKLEKDGLVISFLQSHEPHPPRRIFELTPNGRKTCQDWLTSPVAVPRLVRQEFLAKLYFLLGDKETTRLLIGRQRETCQHWLDKFIHQATHYEAKSYGWQTCQYRIKHAEMILAWLEALDLDL